MRDLFLDHDADFTNTIYQPFDSVTANTVAVVKRIGPEAGVRQMVTI